MLVVPSVPVAALGPDRAVPRPTKSDTAMAVKPKAFHVGKAMLHGNADVSAWPKEPTNDEPPERSSSQARIKEDLGNHSLTALVRVIAETAAAEGVVAVAVPPKRAVTEGVACYAIGIAMDIDASHHWRAVDIDAGAAAEMVIEQAG